MLKMFCIDLRMNWFWSKNSINIEKLDENSVKSCTCGDWIHFTIGLQYFYFRHNFMWVRKSKKKTSICGNRVFQRKQIQPNFIEKKEEKRRMEETWPWEIWMTQKRIARFFLLWSDYNNEQKLTSTAAGTHQTKQKKTFPEFIETWIAAYIFGALLKAHASDVYGFVYCFYFYFKMWSELRC